MSHSVHLITKLSEINSCVKPMVLQFSAEWCGPCKMIAPKVEEIAKENPDIQFFKIDVDKSQAIAQEYGIQAMPTFVFLKTGKEVERFSGASQPKLEEALKNLK